MFLAEVWDVMHEVELSWTCEIHDLVSLLRRVLGTCDLACPEGAWQSRQL